LLDVIGEGGMGIVYRAEHVATRDPVAIKTVRLTHERELESLRREIFALRRIDHPGVVRILAEGVTGGVPWYAMDLLRGETLSDFNRRTWKAIQVPYRDEVETKLDPPTRDDASALPEEDTGPRRSAAAGQLETALELVRALCSSLAFLHGEGIVHRDLKSANVFLREDQSPVLIDFGLVWRFPSALGREVFDVSAPVAGTAGYMAPEQIVGDVVDARADLYAVGCILYELVTGRLPYRNEPLVRKLTNPPRPPSHLVDGVPAPLDDLALRLLEKRPRDRIGHAADVVQAIDAILGREPRASERPPSPRSYVYRPELTGREAPFGSLVGHFENLERGEGGCVVLRGESGIGKTYLAMTAVRLATARGLQVISGSSTPLGASSEMGRPNESPLHPFARFFEAVADRCTVGGHEKTERLLGARGKILGAYEPRFALLPGQDRYAHPPELPAQAARQRLFAALAETIGSYASTWPLVLVLDDLQWADELSQRFLTSLEPAFFATHPILVLATYRVEETSPALSELSSRPHVSNLDLGRLDQTTLATIASDMLGFDGPSPAFCETLASKAEGNPFFVGEYVRAAVDSGIVRRDSGGRWRVEDTAVDIPLPGTLRALVHRRLEGLSSEARALLEVASVVGRDVDATFLAGIRSVGVESQGDAIRELLTRQILEESEPGRLRFLHDKLREHTYEQIERGRRRAVHLATARALEARGEASSALPRLYARLAHHYAETEERQKAIDYLEKAGAQALASFANREAIRFLRQANALDDTSHAHSGRGDGDARLHRARRERLLADAHYALGELDSVQTHGRRALAWMNEPSPESSGGWLAHLSYNASLQVLHRLRPRAFVVAKESERELAREASVATQRLAVSYYYNFDALPMIAASVRSVNLAERAGTGVSAATAYGVLSMTLGISKLHRLGRTYGELARTVARDAGDRVGLVFSLYARAAWRIGDGAWDEVRSLCNEALAVARRDGAIADPQDLAIIETLLAHTEFYTGRFDESRRMFDHIETTARARGNEQHIAWGLYASARALIPLGRTDEARAKLEEAHALLEEQIDAPSRIICPGLLAWVHMARGRHERAATFADLAASRIRKNLPTVFATVAGYVSVADVYLAQWSRAVREGGDVGAARRRAREAMLALWSLALNIPIGRPSYHRMRGRALVLRGRERAARQAFARGIDEATRLAMPYEEALARLELGAASVRGSRAREAELARAEESFVAMQCRDDLVRLRRLEE
jgi:serine/threonine protein kinase/tetratricopeptide (TPR) repeat protein